MPHNRKKLEEIKHAAEKLFATKPDWMTFYREILGLQGLVRRAFPSLEKMAEFEQTGTYRQIHRMVTELRKITPPKVCIEDTQVITIRIPNSMHQALRSEAYELRTSMNKLCISKLLQFINAENVPPAFEEKKPAAPQEEALQPHEPEAPAVFENKESEVGL